MQTWWRSMMLGAGLWLGAACGDSVGQRGSAGGDDGGTDASGATDTAGSGDTGSAADADSDGSGAIPEGCGNGLLEVGEECDDGNTVAADGCEPTCLATAGAPCRPCFDDGACGVLAPACVAIGADRFCLDRCVEGACGPTFTCEPLEVDGSPFDFCTPQIGSCGDPCLDSDGDRVCDSDDRCAVGDDHNDQDGDGVPDVCDENCRNGVDDNNNGLIDCDDLTICGGILECIPAPICGNNLREVGESCDDGNTNAGDGCEPDCTPTAGAVCAPCTTNSECGVAAPACAAVQDGRACFATCESSTACSPGFACVASGDGTSACVPETGSCSAPCADSDADGVCNEDDRCPLGSDRIDSDEDGVPDACDAQVEECGNGLDEDGDGLVDCADPECAASPACGEVGFEICGNGLDDDGDGQIDCDDSLCAPLEVCQNPDAELCSNGVDDNGDGAVDCADRTCVNDPACILATDEICDNAADDDLDGATDCDDADCVDSAPCLPLPTELCDDGEDNDGDGDTDCLDADCARESTCLSPEQICGDNTDNDRDGNTDCDDADCLGTADCPTRETRCSDGLDDNRNGLVDCQDGDCLGDIACPTCLVCGLDNRECTVEGPPAVCGGCLSGFVEVDGLCVCDQAACPSPVGGTCVDNLLSGETVSAVDSGTVCECVAEPTLRDCAAEGLVCRGTGEDAGCTAEPPQPNPWIAYTHGSTGDPATQFWAVRADGTGATQLTDVVGRKGSFTWAVDGRSAYFSMNQGAGFEVYHLPLAPLGTPERVTLCPEAGTVFGLAASPDGRHLVLQSYDLAEADFGVLRLDLATGTCTPVIDESRFDESAPVVLTCGADALVSVVRSEHGRSSFSVNLVSETGAASSAPIWLTNFLGTATYSSACTRVCFSRNVAEVPTLYCGAFEGRRLVGEAPVAGGEAMDSPVFLPASPFVVATQTLVEGSNINPDVVLINVETGESTRLTSTEGFDGAPVPSPVSSEGISLAP